MIVPTLFMNLNDAINIAAGDVASDPQLARLELPLFGDAQRGSVDALERLHVLAHSLLQPKITLGM